MSGLEADYGDPLAALDCFIVAIRNYHDSGKHHHDPQPLSGAVHLFDRLRHYEPAATIAGFAVNLLTPLFTGIDTAIAHLRAVLGDKTYESFARKGEAMTTSAIASYAYDQIDRARIELERQR